MFLSLDTIWRLIIPNVILAFFTALTHCFEGFKSFDTIHVIHKSVLQHSVSEKRKDWDLHRFACAVGVLVLIKVTKLFNVLNCKTLNSQMYTGSCG